MGDLAEDSAPAPGLQTGSEGRASPSDPLLTHPVTMCRDCAGQRSPALTFSSPSRAGGLFTGRHRGGMPDNQLVFGNRLCPLPRVPNRVTQALMMGERENRLPLVVKLDAKDMMNYQMEIHLASLLGACFLGSI